MPTDTVAVLSVSQDGRVTLPAGYRKRHRLARGSKVVAVRMGEALVMVPHDPLLESAFLRLEAALAGASATVESLKDQPLAERARIVRKRYDSARVEEWTRDYSSHASPF